MFVCLFVCLCVCVCVCACVRVRVRVNVLPADRCALAGGAGPRCGSQSGCCASTCSSQTPPAEQAVSVSSKFLFTTTIYCTTESSSLFSSVACCTDHLEAVGCRQRAAVKVKDLRLVPYRVQRAAVEKDGKPVKFLGVHFFPRGLVHHSTPSRTQCVGSVLGSLRR